MEYEWKWKQDLTSTIPGSNRTCTGSVVCSFEWDLQNLFFAGFPNDKEWYLVLESLEQVLILWRVFWVLVVSARVGVGRPRPSDGWREGTEIRPRCSVPRPKAASSVQTVSRRQTSVLRRRTPGEESLAIHYTRIDVTSIGQSVAPGNKNIDICKAEAGKLR